MFFDPLYFLILAPGLALAAWAQWRVSSAYGEAVRIPASTGLTGAQAAYEILRAEGVRGVEIEPVAGHLSDHYDPTSKVLRLSEDVYAGTSIASVGIAAHEAGHAIQDARHYSPLVVRNLVVPVASLGSNLSWILLMIGLFMASMQLIVAGIVLFSTTVFFQLVNLPVEFDASARARRALVATGIVRPQEDYEVGRVLNAAAMTYVAATLTSVLTLLYFVLRSGLLGGRSEE